MGSSLGAFRENPPFHRALFCKIESIPCVSDRYVIRSWKDLIAGSQWADIPENEQFEMSGIEEAGPAWKFSRKFISRFYLYGSRTMETAEFFVTKSSDFGILISQKQYARMAELGGSPRQKLLWMPKKKRSKSKLFLYA